MQCSADLLRAVSLNSGKSLKLCFDKSVNNRLRYGWFKWAVGRGCQEVTYELVFADIITMKTFVQDVLENQRYFNINHLQKDKNKFFFQVVQISKKISLDGNKLRSL